MSRERLATILTRHRGDTTVTHIHSELELRGCDISYQAVARWFAGDRIPQGPALLLLCDILRLDDPVRAEVFMLAAVGAP